MFNLGNRSRALREQVDTLQEEIAPLRVDKERLRKELGVDRAADIISLVRNLEGKVAELTPPPALEGENEDSLSALSDPKTVLAKIKQFTGRIENLNGTVASMEEQLVSLYADKERLEQAIGASEVEDVIEAFRHLQTVIGSMESQLMTMYAGREHLEVGVGDSDPKRMVNRFREMARLVRAMERELGETVFTDLEESQDTTNGKYLAPSAGSIKERRIEEGSTTR